VTAFIITRIQTGDYERWRPMFDQDKPRARETALTQRVLMRSSSTSSFLRWRRQTRLARAWSPPACSIDLKTSMAQPS
jgi:hypothetical protein